MFTHRNTKFLKTLFCCVLFATVNSFAASETGPRNKFLETVNRWLPTRVHKALAIGIPAVAIIGGTVAVVLWKNRSKQSDPKPDANQNSVPGKDGDSSAKDTTLTPGTEGVNDEEDDDAADDEGEDNRQDRGKAPTEGATNNPSLPKQQNTNEQQRSKLPLPEAKSQEKATNGRSAAPKQSSSTPKTNTSKRPVYCEPREPMEKFLNDLARKSKVDTPRPTHKTTNIDKFKRSLPKTALKLNPKKAHELVAAVEKNEKRMQKALQCGNVNAFFAAADKQIEMQNALQEKNVVGIQSQDPVDLICSTRKSKAADPYEAANAYKKEPLTEPLLYGTKLQCLCNSKFSQNPKVAVGIGMQLHNLASFSSTICSGSEAKERKLIAENMALEILRKFSLPPHLTKDQRQVAKNAALTFQYRFSKEMKTELNRIFTEK